MRRTREMGRSLTTRASATGTPAAGRKEILSLGSASFCRVLLPPEGPEQAASNEGGLQSCVRVPWSRGVVSPRQQLLQRRLHDGADDGCRQSPLGHEQSEDTTGSISRTPV